MTMIFFFAHPNTLINKIFQNKFKVDRPQKHLPYKLDYLNDYLDVKKFKGLQASFIFVKQTLIDLLKIGNKKVQAGCHFKLNFKSVIRRSYFASAKSTFYQCYLLQIFSRKQSSNIVKYCLEHIPRAPKKTLIR